MQPESTLNQLKAALPGGQLPSSFGVYFKTTLVALCHALEDHILQTAETDINQQPLVVVAFQQGKWYLPFYGRNSRIFVISWCVCLLSLASLSSQA